MSLNNFHIKVGLSAGTVVGITSANMAMITESFNTASGFDWKTGAYALAGAILGGLVGSEFMSDRTADMPLKTLNSIGDLTWHKNRLQIIKPFAGAVIGTAIFTSGYMFDKTNENLSLPVPTQHTIK